MSAFVGKASSLSLSISPRPHSSKSSQTALSIIFSFSLLQVDISLSFFNICYLFLFITFLNSFFFVRHWSRNLMKKNFQLNLYLSLSIYACASVFLSGRLTTTKVCPQNWCPQISHFQFSHVTTIFDSRFLVSLFFAHCCWVVLCCFHFQTF